MDRTEVTPGRLYALLSAAFQDARAETCRMCKMPLPYLLGPAGGSSANWSVGESIHSCPACRELMESIVENLSKFYDIRDLTRDRRGDVERRSRPRNSHSENRARPGL